MAPGCPDTLDHWSVIDFVIISDLWWYVLEDWVKRVAELSSDHHLEVSWIRGWEKMLDRRGVPQCTVRVHWECLRAKSARSSTSTSSRVSVALRGRLRTLSLSGSSFMPPLQRLMQRGVAARLFLPILAVIPGELEENP